MPDASTKTQEAGHAPENGARPTDPPPLVLPAFDIRRKRPPALSFLLRMDTLRRLCRVVSLLALDFAGVFAAIFTALMVKAAIRDGEWAWHASFVETKQTI